MDERIAERLRKTSAELVKIEEAIKSGGSIETSILVEFRDAVDHVRKTAWAVQEWQERQKRDPHTVLSLITTERIRRATQLNSSIAEDLQARKINRETAGMAELFRVTERLYQQTVDLFPCVIGIIWSDRRNSRVSQAPKEKPWQTPNRFSASSVLTLLEAQQLG